MNRRRLAVAALLVFGTISIAGGLVAGYVRDTLVDSEEFADRAEDAISTPEVRESVTNEIVAQITAVEPELLTVQPLLETVVDRVLRVDLTRNIIRAAVQEVHQSVFDQQDDDITMHLTDVILVAKTQLTVLDPEIGALIPDDLTDAIVSVEAEQFIVDAAQLGDDLRFVAFVLPLAGLAAFVAALWMASDSSAMLVRVGLSTVVAAASVLVFEQVMRAWFTRADDGPSADIARAVWDAFIADIDTWAIVLGSVGAVVAAVAWFGVGETDIQQGVGRLGHLVRPRSAPWQRVTWGLAVFAFGLFVILKWQLSMRFGITVVGSALAIVGLREMVATLAPGLVTGAGASRDDTSAADTARSGRWLGTLALVGLGAVALVAIWLSGGDNGTAEATDPGCNGSVLLCDRPFDEVVLAASHNSHAASNDGFVLGYQTVGIVPQLEEGVRGLLIDVYFGLQVGDGPVVTDRAPITAAEREQLVAEVGESAVRSAEATVERTAQLGGDRGLYLCHAFCEIGARPFVSEMVAVREFLEEHPREVIVMIIQDEGPTPADIAAAFDEAGLDQLVHTQQPGEPWPTLGEMIDADSRVFVSAENQSGRFDWYHDAFTSVQDTPFDYETVESFDCARNRGAPESPLLLVNHWLNPVSPRAADEANSAQVLLERVDECRADGRGTPNLIAVDFQDRGDLLQVVKGLNDL